MPWRSLRGDAQRIVERVTPLLYDSQSVTARCARRDRGRLLSRSKGFRRGPLGARGRQHPALRGRVAKRRGGHLCRGRAAPGRRHPRPVQLGARKLARDDAAVLSNVRISLQSHAAPSARPSLLDDRLQPRRQGRHPQRDRRADAHQRPAIAALAGRAGNRRGGLHVRCLRLPSEGDPRPTDPVVQVGALPGRCAR